MLIGRDAHHPFKPFRTSSRLALAQARPDIIVKNNCFQDVHRKSQTGRRRSSRGLRVDLTYLLRPVLCSST